MTEGEPKPRTSRLILAPICAPLVAIGVGWLLIPGKGLAWLPAVFLWCYALLAAFEYLWFGLHPSRWAIARPWLFACLATLAGGLLVGRT